MKLPPADLEFTRLAEKENGFKYCDRIKEGSTYGEVIGGTSVDGSPIVFSPNHGKFSAYDYIESRPYILRFCELNNLDPKGLHFFTSLTQDRNHVDILVRDGKCIKNRTGSLDDGLALIKNEFAIVDELRPRLEFRGVKQGDILRYRNVTDKEDKIGVVVGFNIGGSPIIFNESGAHSIDAFEENAKANTSQWLKEHGKDERRARFDVVHLFHFIKSISVRTVDGSKYPYATIFVSDGITDTVETEKINTFNKKEAKKMTGTEAFMAMLKDNATKAGYRVASTQMVTATRAAIVSLLQKKGAGDDKIAAANTFFDSELGTVFISMFLGMTMPYIPKYGEDPRVAKLAEEFRVGGMATAGNALMSEFTSTLLPVLNDLVKAIPAEEVTSTEKVRLTEKKPSLFEEEEEDTTETKATKTRHA